MVTRRKTLFANVSDVEISSDDLVLLATIADVSSLSAVARQLGVSQPAISKQLRRLEETLNVSLFSRGARGLHPTEQCEALLLRGRSIRSLTQQAMQDVRQQCGLREGRLTIALSHFATVALLPQVIEPFHRRWPRVHLNIVPPTFSLDGLREGAPDFAVMSLPNQKLGREFVARPLYTTEIVVVARRGHPLGHAEQLQDLKDAQWVLPSMDSAIAHGLGMAYKKAKMPALHCAMTCQTLTGLEVLAQTTDLLTAMPAEVFEARCTQLNLQRLPIKQPIEGPRVALLRWVDAWPTPASAELQESFVKVAHQMARKIPAL